VTEDPFETMLAAEAAGDWEAAAAANEAWTAQQDEWQQRWLEDTPEGRAQVAEEKRRELAQRIVADPAGTVRAVFKCARCRTAKVIARVHVSADGTVFRQLDPDGARMGGAQKAALLARWRRRNGGRPVPGVDGTGALSAAEHQVLVTSPEGWLHPDPIEVRCGVHGVDAMTAVDVVNAMRTSPQQRSARTITIHR